MTKTVMYGATIAILSILLFGVLALDAEAKKSLDEPIFLKGIAAEIFVSNDDIVGGVGVFPILDSKDVLIFYSFTENNGDVSTGMCTTSNHIIKNSALKKASINFDTADLDCNSQAGPGGIVSLNLLANDDKPTKVKKDKTKCTTFDGVETCFRNHKTEEFVGADVEGTVFGISVENGQGFILKIFTQLTSWTTP